MDKSTQFILWFKDLTIEDVPLVGGKNASLGEMYSNLTVKKVHVPNGFAITAYAYRYLLEKAGIKDRIRQILSGLDTHDMQNLAERGHQIRALIRTAEFPPELSKAIIAAYAKLCKECGKDTDVAVRSSATAEDLPDASFAGQQETYLNIRGAYRLIEACKKCFASLFTNRAISYREDKHFDHFSIALSIGVQRMVRSDLASSGVMFSIDTESGFKDVVLVTGAWGLGENIVQGAVNPDEFYVHKPTLKQGYPSIISKTLGSKELKMVYDIKGHQPTKNMKVDISERKKYVLSDKEVLTLATWACVIEDHYSHKAGHFKPMDIEWAKDGISGQLYIVQARPETVQSQKNRNVMEEYVLKQKGKILCQGKSVGTKIGQGKTTIIKDVHDIARFRKGEVLVTEMTDPDWEPIMKVASAIVTNRGGRTCHAAIISRELGIPCVVGCGNATELIKQGKPVTVVCSQGDDGFVYEGLLKYEVAKHNLLQIPQTHTKIMMNVGEPEHAFELSFIPNQGVGLARMEFIINNWIKVHPKALLHFDKVTDSSVRERIEAMTQGYKTKADYFVDKLSQGIARIASAFYPHDVILRFSDFKTNEYANLLGGAIFEPKEDNPMIGWRGASRYYDKKYADAFGLECMAIRKVREEMGLLNLKVMVPFCRTVEEGTKVQAEMARYGLKRGVHGLQVYVMCEIPSNVILADQFSQIFDGFSIGSNDLTQLTLGLDRDSEIVSHIYDERNEAVKRMIRMAITTVHKYGRKIGICGQAPSDFPDFAQFLVECGIDSISLNPDSVLKTTFKIHEQEKKLGMK
ncbi:phosphoenolpyruvate synthase [Candidatus Woesearchaeota archaeon]|nr:phosphoenolpyruvate synthase [Candidatus Woesearchaeota archaeon]